MKTLFYRFLALGLCAILVFSCVSCSCKVFSDPFDDIRDENTTAEENTPPENIKTSNLQWIVTDEPTCTNVGKATNRYTYKTCDIPMKDHSYTEYVPDAKYLKEPANCCHGDVYYKSCECGAVGDETFEAGSMTEHKTVNGVCEACGKKWSEGLRFVSNGDGTCYVKDSGDCADSYVWIPEVSPAGDKVTALGKSAFYKNQDIETVYIPEGVTTIGETCFYLSSLTYVYLPSTLRAVGTQAFANSNIEILKLPDGLDTISKGAFSPCSNLKVIIFPSFVKTLSGFERRNNPYLVFFGSLEQVLSHKTSTGLASSDSAITTRFYIGGQLLTDLVIPAGTTNLDLTLFQGYSSIETVTVQPGVSMPEAKWFLNFYTVKKITFEEGCQFNEIGNEAFRKCLQLETVDLPESITFIGKNAFAYCESLKGIAIPEHVKTIDGRAFYGCLALETVEIPDSVTSLGANAFADCMSLKSVSIGSGVTIISPSCFSNCTELETIINGSSISVIGYDAFGGCTSLRELILPDSLRSVESWAFIGCTSLWRIVIPPQIAVIDTAAFDNCPNLVEIINKSATALSTLTNDANSTLFLNALCISNEMTTSTVETVGDFVIYHGETGTYLIDYVGNNVVVALPELDKTYKIKDGMFTDKNSVARCLIIPLMVESVGLATFSGFTDIEEICVESGMVDLSSNRYLSSLVPEIFVTDRSKLKYSEQDGAVFRTVNGKTEFIGLYGSNSEGTIPACAPNGETYTIYKYSIFNNSIKSLTVEFGTTMLEKSSFLPGLSQSSVLSGLSQIETLHLAYNVTTIKEKTFDGLSSIETLVLPSSLKEFDLSSVCSPNFGTICFDGTEDEWNSIKKTSEFPNETKEVYLFCNDTITRIK